VLISRFVVDQAVSAGILTRLWAITVSVARSASLEHGELVAQDQDLDLLAGVGSRPEHDPAQELGEHLVDQPQRHQRIMPGYLPRTNEQVTGCVRSFGHPHLPSCGWTVLTPGGGHRLCHARGRVRPGGTSGYGWWTGGNHQLVA
jgi:hypothetical protein